MDTAERDYKRSLEYFFSQIINSIVFVPESNVIQHLQIKDIFMNLILSLVRQAVPVLPPFAK